MNPIYKHCYVVVAFNYSQFKQSFYGHHHGGGGLVVSVLAFYTNDLSSNHAEPLEKNKKRPGLANLKTKYRT